MSPRNPRPTADRTSSDAPSPTSLFLAGIALVCIVAGFVLLSRGSISAAPLLLVAGYVVLLPLAILR